MNKRNIFLTATLAATLLLAACNTAENSKEETVEEERAVEETIEPTEPVRDETTDEAANTTVNDPAAEQSPVSEQGVVTDSVNEEHASSENDAPVAAASQQVAVTKPSKKSNEVVLYKGDANAEKVVPAQTIPYTYKTNGPITKYIIDQLGYSQYYNKHSVSADERVIMIDFKDNILSSQVIQGSAGGLMFQNSIVASIFENIPSAQVVKLRVNGKEEVLDHVSFAGEITRAQFQAAQ